MRTEYGLCNHLCTPYPIVEHLKNTCRINWLTLFSKVLMVGPNKTNCFSNRQYNANRQVAFQPGDELMKITHPLTRVALWTFVLGTLFLSFSPLPATAVDVVDDLFAFWNARYVTGADIFPPPSARPIDRKLSTVVLAKAKPDECFFDPGDSGNDFQLFDLTDPESCYGRTGAGDGINGEPAKNGTPKVNQAYVWGLAKAGSTLWFGTGPNTHCLVSGTYLQNTDPTINENYVCEFGESQFTAAFLGLGVSSDLAAALGDWRPPRIFAYDTQSATLTEKTGAVYASPPDQARLAASLGIRSAGALDDIVILGGPGFAPSAVDPVLEPNDAAPKPAVNLFAFNTQTGEFISSTSLTDYTNIRKWLVIDGVLYTAVGGESGGAVLRWVGTPTAPFSNGENGFEVVGTLTATGAELALHDGRLFVSTWAGEELAGQGEAGIYMSPVIPDGGVGLPASTVEWEKVWTISDYEPDPVTARSYGGGALASFGGYLYWGTMNVPLLSTAAHLSVYSQLIDAGIYPDDPGDSMEDRQIKAFLATHRPISIFRGRNFDTAAKEVELLYGLNKMYAFNPPAVAAIAGGPPPLPVGWNLVPNKMGMAPLYGQAGFDNFYNSYTWTMAVFNGKLYVGTLDFAILFTNLANIDPDSPLIQYAPRSDLGADLMRFDSATAGAVGESFSGVGNYSTYGVRTMVADDALYLGMANPMNMRTDPADAQGGWELIKATEQAGTVTGGSSGGGCFVSAAGFKDRLHTSPIFAILFSLGVITVLCALGMAIQRRKTGS